MIKLFFSIFLVISTITSYAQTVDEACDIYNKMYEIADLKGTDSAFIYLKYQETIFGRSPKILSLYANLFEYDIKNDSAKVYYRLSLDAGPNDAFVLNNYGNNISNISTDSAFFYYKKALEIFPTYLDPVVGIGFLYINLNKLQEAIINFEQVAERHPFKYEIYVDIAYCYSILDNKDSLKYYLDLIPKDFTTNFNHFYLQLNMLPLTFSDDNTAFNFLSKFLNKEPKTKYDYWLKSFYYFRVKDYKKCKEYFDIFAINTEFNDNLYLCNLTILFFLKDNVEFKKVCESAIKKYPNDYRFYEAYARCLGLFDRNYEECIKYLDAAITKNDTCISCYDFKSHIAVFLGKSDIEIESIDKAFELIETKTNNGLINSKYYISILKSHATKHFYRKDEIKYCQEFLFKYGDDESVLNCLFLYYFKNSKIKETQEIVDKLEKIEFIYNYSLGNLGLFYLQMRNHEKSNYYFLKYLLLDSTQTHLYKDIATNYMQLKDYDNTIKYFSKAIDVNPSDNNSYYNLACAYSILHKESEAILNLRKAIELNSSLKNNAREDPDFNNIKDTEEFKNLIK